MAPSDWPISDPMNGRRSCPAYCRLWSRPAPPSNIVELLGNRRAATGEQLANIDKELAIQVSELEKLKVVHTPYGPVFRCADCDEEVDP